MKATYVGALPAPTLHGTYVEFRVTVSLPTTGLAKDSPAPARGSYGSLDAVCDETSMGTCGAGLSGQPGGAGHCRGDLGRTARRAFPLGDGAEKCHA